MQILIVDDHRLLVGELIREIGALFPEDQCTGTYSGESALALAETKQFDAALLDIDMPRMDGLTLARRLMEKQPHINIIFITGYPHYALQSYEVYASAFLVKPVSDKQLKMAFENLRHPVVRQNDNFFAEHYSGSNSLGSKIREQRLRSGLSVKNVAERMNVSVQTVYRWENGERVPDIVTFLTLANLFGTTVEKMLEQ